jgi:hypothetical protein
LQTIRHILSLHVLVDYYGDKKLKKLAHGTTASSSMYQVRRRRARTCKLNCTMISLITY